MVIVNGKTYASMHEYMEDEKHNPNSTNLVWDYQDYQNVTFINGKMIYPEGKQGRGRCWWHGKCYEGDIEYRGQSLYVGGVYVKDV